MASFEACSVAIPSVEETRSEIDPAALVATYATLLFRVAYSILRSRSEAEDVVQDVYVRILQHKRTLPEVRDMRVWLIRIAWNRALDRRRRIRPEQFDLGFAENLAGHAMPADQRMAEAQQMKAVLLEMERLPRQERHVLLLSAIEELDVKEIAQVLGRSESAVRALLFRARTRLRERLDKGAHPR